MVEIKKKKSLNETCKEGLRPISRREFAIGSLAIGTYHAISTETSVADPLSTAVTLEVLNPLGEIEPPPTLGINARIPDLNNKTVALMDNWKTGGIYLQDRFEELLKKKYPNVSILRTTKPEGKEGGGRLIYSADPWYSEVAKAADAFIYTIGD